MYGLLCVLSYRESITSHSYVYDGELKENNIPISLSCLVRNKMEIYCPCN